MHARVRILMASFALGALLVPLGSASSEPLVPPDMDGPWSVEVLPSATASGLPFDADQSGTIPADPCREACRKFLLECTNACGANQPCVDKCEELAILCMAACAARTDAGTGLLLACLRQVTGPVNLTLA